jgi:hypothetical protein
MLVKFPDDARAENAMQRIQEIWSIVATWGRWCDKQKQLPSVDEAIRAIPRWFSDFVETDATASLDNWMNDLDDRDWVVWSVARQENVLKIDLDSEAAPFGTYPLDIVIFAVGGSIASGDLWVDNVSGIIERIEARRQMRRSLGGIAVFAVIFTTIVVLTILGVQCRLGR